LKKNKKKKTPSQTPPSLLSLLSFLAAAQLPASLFSAAGPPLHPAQLHLPLLLTGWPSSPRGPPPPFSSPPARTARAGRWPFLLTPRPNVQPAAQDLPLPLFFFFRSLPAGARMSGLPPTFRPLPCLALPRLPRRPPAVTASIPRPFHLQAINQEAFVLDFHSPSINSLRFILIKGASLIAIHPPAAMAIDGQLARSPLPLPPLCYKSCA
jgi:hypothetical protein